MGRARSVATKEPVHAGARITSDELNQGCAKAIKAIAWIVPGGVHPSGERAVIPALVSLIERLARDVRLTVVVLGQSVEPIRFELLGAKVVDVGQRAGRVLRLRAVMRALAEDPPDVLHAFWAGSPGLIGVVAARQYGCPLVLSLGGGELVWLKDIDYGGQGSARSRAVCALALRFADVVTAGSRAMQRRLPERMPSRWIPLGADTSRFEGPVDRARAQGAPFRLLHVGSINRVKDPETLLSCMRILRSKGENVVLDWVGEDTLGGEVQRRARELDLSQHVQFHGFRTQVELVPLFRAADLYVQSSRHESQGVAVLEAAASGLPIVGTAVGLVAELARAETRAAERGGNTAAALAVPVRDPAALSRAISDLVRAEDVRFAIARTARTFALQFGADWTAGQFAALYAEVAATGPGERRTRSANGK